MSVLFKTQPAHVSLYFLVKIVKINFPSEETNFLFALRTNARVKIIRENPSDAISRDTVSLITATFLPKFNFYDSANSISARVVAGDYRWKLHLAAKKRTSRIRSRGESFLG